MPEGLKIKQGTQQSVRALLSDLLESGRVSSVLCLGSTGDDRGMAYSLFTHADAFLPDGAARPLFPLMPANAGGMLSRLTLKGAPAEPVAAVVKPCELRAFIELVKPHQGTVENILLISSTCGGVYPLEASRKDNLKASLPGYWQAVAAGETDARVRSSCRACEQFVPRNADISIVLLGEADLERQCTLYLNTEKGASSVEGLAGIDGVRISGDLDSAELKSFSDQRMIFREEAFAAIDVGQPGLIDTFGRCINCHACMTVCPMCYCPLCYFDSRACEHSIDFYESEMERKGAQRVPADTLYFQLGRLTHMSISCVGCGMCSDVCPVEIPLTAIYSKVGDSVQALFDYRPGNDLTEEIPLRTFEVEEFARMDAKELK